LPHQTLQKFDQKRSAEDFLLKESFIEEKAVWGKRNNLQDFNCMIKLNTG